MSTPGVPSSATRQWRRARRFLWQKTAPAKALRARVSGQTPRRVLLISDGRAYTSEQQFAPLFRYGTQIAARTGLVFSQMDLAHAERLGPDDLKGYGAVGLKLHFDTPPDRAAALARRIFGAAGENGARRVIFDGNDDQAAPWPEVLDLADTCIKKHRYSDLAAYREAHVGKSNLTDYAHRTYGVSFAEDITPSSGGLSETQIDKIVLGWNIAYDDKIFDLADDIPQAATTGPRDLDFLCRASVAPHVWTHGIRDAAVQAINALSDRYSVHAPTDRVPPAGYYREMLRARVSVSPFGFGELCWRDFEAILCGSVLVKPDMSHVATFPDLYVPHETYVPVAWDYSDLEKATAPYLTDDAAREKFTRTARERLLNALSPDSFLPAFETTMRAAGVL